MRKAMKQPFERAKRLADVLHQYVIVVMPQHPSGALIQIVLVTMKLIGFQITSQILHKPRKTSISD